MTRHHSRRVSPFGHPRIHARLTTPRGISQPPTSFIGSQCQGIHHAPLHTYNTKNQKMRKNCTSTTNKPTTGQPHGEHTLAARCSQPLSTNQTPHPTTKAGATTNHSHPPATAGPKTAGLVVSKPNSVSGNPVTGIDHSNPVPAHRLSCTRSTPLQRLTPHGPHPHHLGVFLVVLLRKEVIQPHLPVRLPCYDFVPIADPTFDGSLHKGWATGFGCYRLS